MRNQTIQNFQIIVDEFVANDSSHKSKDGNNIIKRSALIPTPGCRQYDSYPVVVNKENFEVQFWISKKQGNILQKKVKMCYNLIWS